MNITDLENKRVLITGAASGIGRAAAFAFARRGADIIASDLSYGALCSLRDEVQALGARCSIHVVNVADSAAMQAFADEVGAPDVLINNAGIAYLGLFLKSDLAHWQRVLDVNLMGVVHGCRHFLPLMLEAGGPRRVLNVASTAGVYPVASMGAYAASKFAVFGFSEVLKMELAGSAVGVTTVCPGIINTPIVRTPNSTAPSITENQLQHLQAYYAAEGCSPDVVAEGMVKAVLKGQSVLMVGPYAKLIYHLRRISLSLTRRLALNDARKMGFLS